jgi:hypothetical protein
VFLGITEKAEQLQSVPAPEKKKKKKKTPQNFNLKVSGAA